MVLSTECSGGVAGEILANLAVDSAERNFTGPARVFEHDGQGQLA
jgi:hypothetical protein